MAAAKSCLDAANQRYFKLGLIGHPVSHSISPLLHGAALSYAKLAGEYNLIDVESNDLDQKIRQMVAHGYAGWNVTVPHKQRMYELAHELSDEARKVKAVNTVGVADGGKLIGHNTDLGGFIHALSHLIPESVRSKPGVSVVLGAGGAARAAVWGLIALKQTSVAIIARNVSQAQALQEEVFAHDPTLRDSMTLTVIKPDALDALAPRLIVNCTPVGLGNRDIPEWIQKLIRSSAYMPGESWLYDMVYAYGHQVETPLVQFASCQEKMHARNGLEMLINQALLAFEFWTGARVPEDVMLTAIRK